MLALAVAVVLNGLCLAAGLQVEEWFNSNQQLRSEDLIELVPLANAPGFGTDRFSLDHIWQLRSLSGVFRDNEAPRPQINFENFVAEHGDSPDDHYKYGEMLFYGVGGIPRNLTRAAEFYQLAAAKGHAEAQFMMGVAYSSGLYGNWPQNEALATMYYTFSAMNYSTRGLVTMGYRYRNGIGSPIDHDQAYGFYSNAADACLDYYEDFPYVGNRYEPFLAHIIADEYSYGIYGKLRSRGSSKRTRLRKLLREFDSVQEGLDYLEFSAFEEGEVNALQFLATAYQLDIKNGLPDFEAAAEKAEELISRTKGDNSKDGRFLRSWGLCVLADCYRRGAIDKFDIDKAKKLYHEALEVAVPTRDDPKLKNCPQCYTGLGLIAVYELQQEPSLDTPHALELHKKARSYFKPGSLLSSPYSQYYLGKELFEQGHLEEASVLLGKCDSEIPLAAHTLGLIHRMSYESTGSILSLKTSVDEMAMACEQNQELYSPVRWAHYAYKADQDAALIGFTVAAELGSTSAVINIADILDVQHSSLSVDWLRSWPVPAYVDEKVRASTAFKYFVQAAQYAGSRESVYKVGDYLYYGIGTTKHVSAAIKIYDVLCRRYAYPMAYWAIGWMYDMGVGLPQNFNTANEYYFSALAFSGTRASYICIKLSVLSLYIRWFIAKWSGVDVGSLSRTIPDSQEKKSWLQAIRDARQIIEDSQGPAEDATVVLEELVGEQEYDGGAFLVDISIIVLVCALLGTLIWFRRRRGIAGV